jgi:hypothetical protein
MPAADDKKTNPGCHERIKTGVIQHRIEYR